jgi:hypothetical protein
MGKVTYKELPKDHSIFKAGWIISTIKKQPKKTHSVEKLKDSRNKDKK